jgi:hypothetical protein
MGKGRRKIKPSRRNPIARILASGKYRGRRKPDKRRLILDRWIKDDARKGLFD